MYQWMVKAEVEDGHAKNKTRYAEHVFQFIHHPSIHLSATMVIPLSIRPPSSSRQYAWNYYQVCLELLGLAVSHKSDKSGQNGGRFFCSEEGRTGRLQVSGPIGVRWWRIHLPTQTAQRSRVLHLSQRIAPLSRPLVLQHLFQVLTIQNSCKHSMCKMMVVVVGRWVWNVKVQRSPWSGWCWTILFICLFGY